jgi:hypothetical protein
MGVNINTDIEGVIRELNLSETEVLYPFFEAVVNSIQSIHEIQKLGSIEQGEISIFIERDRQELIIFEKEGNYPIKSIKIVDNGIGFNQSNYYNGFLKSHSTQKLNIGGKGLGRFTMLSVFDSIKVKSIYKESLNDKVLSLRSFELSRKDGIIEDNPIPAKSSKNTTEIILSNINSKFKQATAKYPQENIADSILEHCLLYYLSNEAPIIKVVENDEAINLTKQFNPTDFVKHKVEGKVLNDNFVCYFVKNNKLKAHEYLLCAHNRKVRSKRIDKIFPIFTSKITDEGGEECWLQIYVVSNYLNDKVNISRNEIIFPKVQEDTENEDGAMKEFKSECRTVIIEKDIDNFVIKGLENKYQDIIEKRKDYLRRIVNSYISSDEGLEYRSLDIDNAFLTTIPDTADDKKLDDILHDYQYKKRNEIRKKRERLLKKDFSRRKDYQSLLADVVSLITKEGNLRLGQYVAHRKTIIELLDKYLDWCEENNNYAEEAALHNLIFAMGGSHENTPYDSHNLWLLDDRLSFHRYIYSDTAVNKHKPKKGKTNSGLETDLAIYDVPYTYGEKTEYEEVASAVIFEFKRPDRPLTYDEFSKQMGIQIEAVNAGKVIDKNGKHVTTSESTPVFYYYVCDINAYNSLKSRAKIEGFRETPYKSLMRLVENIYVEIMTYQTLLVNSRRRNKVFFKKLGIE